MLYKTAGKTGKKISAVGFGGMRFDKPAEIDRNAEVVLHAYRSGINYFDTAPYYCDDKSEDIFGAALRQMKPGTFYISSKCPEDDAASLRRDLEKSLKRLGVPKINFYHIWCVCSLEAWRKRAAAVTEAIKAREEGLIEHLCISLHLRSDEIKQVLDEAPFESVTLGYCALNFQYREAGIAEAARRGMAVMTMNPLFGGIIPANAERLAYLRGPKDRSVTEAAIRFNVSNPGVTCALVGFTKPAQIDEAVAAVTDFEPYDAAYLDAMRKKIVDSFDDLCTCCGYCLPCPQGIEITKMMDSYNSMMLTGKGRQRYMDRLNNHWNIDPASSKRCTQCGQCEKRCTQHLPIMKRMKEIAG